MNPLSLLGENQPLEPWTEPRGEGRRGFLGAAILGVAALPATAQTVDAEAKIQGLTPEDAAAAAGYSPGIAAEGHRVVFVSGQGPADLKADLETQMRQTFDRIGVVLKAGGASFKNVVMLRAYFTNMKRALPVYRKVRMDYLVKPYPASTAVGVTELAVAGLEIEIEAVAIV